MIYDYKNQVYVPKRSNDPDIGDIIVWHSRNGEPDEVEEITVDTDFIQDEIYVKTGNFGYKVYEPYS